MSKLDANCDTPRVLIVRLSAIGDVIHGLPVLCALRDRFPQAFLGWVVEGRAATLLRGHPALDEIIEIPRGWLKSPSTVGRLRRRLRSLGFDTAIDVQGLTKSAVAAWLSGARRRIGFGDAKGRELSRWFANEKVTTTAAHIIDSNLELLRPLGITSPAVRFDLPEHADDRQSAEAMIREQGLTDGFAMITPGAGWASKLWPPERFAAVAVYLGRGWGLPTMVVWAGDEEHRLARQIVAAARGHARLAPPTSLTELAALARRARLFVGSDTGPVHLAAAVGTPCVGLYGPMPAERNGPYGSQHIAIEQMRFEGTSRQRRTAPREVMESIQVDHVCDACAQILRREILNVA